MRPFPSHSSGPASPRSIALLWLLESCLLLAGIPAVVAGSTSDLRDALIFHASFDRGADADFARGDPRIYTAAGRSLAQRDAATPGLHAEDLVRVAPGEGRFGGALEFKRKTNQLIFFRGGENIGFNPRRWDGAVSFWLRLDPERDLEPGYCDPVQFVAQAWTEGNLFVEFSRDHRPRHVRFAIMAVTKYWNPYNRKWEEMPDAERPMAAVRQPPFRRDRWTHVLVTFANINSGEQDGRGTLYLDGRKQGRFDGWNNTFNWDVAKSALTLGLNYTGFIDDLAVFDRELTDAEAAAVYALQRGIAGLRDGTESSP